MVRAHVTRPIERKALMASSAPARFTLEEGGHLYAVETDSAGLHTVARLFVDGQQADEQKGMEKAILLHGGGLAVVVGLDFLGNATEILAVPDSVPPDKVKERAAEEGVAFTPPAGSRAARMDELRRNHPTLYAARHVVLAIGQVLIGVLGVGALLWGIVQGLLPRITLLLPDLPDIPWPNIDLPAIPWPDLPWPNIAIDLPDLSFLALLKDLWNSVNWIVPIVIALFVAWNEIEKRRKREARGG
jgi:hypothetical protein